MFERKTKYNYITTETPKVTLSFDKCNLTAKGRSLASKCSIVNNHQGMLFGENYVQQKAIDRYHSCERESRFFALLANIMSVAIIIGSGCHMWLGFSPHIVGITIGCALSQCAILPMYYKQLRDMRAAIIDCI